MIILFLEESVKIVLCSVLDSLRHWTTLMNPKHGTGTLRKIERQNEWLKSIAFCAQNWKSAKQDRLDTRKTCSNSCGKTGAMGQKMITKSCFTRFHNCRVHQDVAPSSALSSSQTLPKMPKLRLCLISNFSPSVCAHLPLPLVDTFLWLNLYVLFRFFTSNVRLGRCKIDSKAKVSNRLVTFMFDYSTFRRASCW